jgi:hypothetical protein
MIDCPRLDSGGQAFQKLVILEQRAVSMKTIDCGLFEQRTSGPSSWYCLYRDKHELKNLFSESAAIEL